MVDRAENAAKNVAEDLAEMSLEDFLQESEPTLVHDDYTGFYNKPVDRPYRRWFNRGSGGRGGGHSDVPYPGGVPYPQRGWRGNPGIRTGVLLTHDLPRKLHPLTRKSPQSRPQESVLTVGSHEAVRVKEGGSSRAARSHQTGGYEGSHVPTLDVEAVLNNALQPPDHQELLTFVLNESLPPSLHPGQRCHCLPVQDLAQIRRDTILKLLVGLLNTGERGVIYLGVREDGRVEGVACEAQMVAQFVEGLMKTVQFYLMPRLHAPQYGVRYTNVMTASGQVLNNMWVVELHAVPQMHHYYNAVMDMSYHVRHGKHILSLPFGTFCSAMVASASQPYLEEEAKLLKQIKSMKETLQQRGIKVPSEGEDNMPHVCDKCLFNDCPVQYYGKSVCGQ